MALDLSSVPPGLRYIADYLTLEAQERSGFFESGA
jgi:hypothetical protein